MTVRVLVFVWLANFFLLVGLPEPSVKVPDAEHTVQVHVRGKGDYYCGALEGIYRNYVGNTIFLAGMIGLGIVALLKRSS